MCDNLYYHRYYPTRYDTINNPWYPGNICPFSNLNPTSSPTIFPPFNGTSINPIKPFSYSSITGVYGYPSSNTSQQKMNCNWGFQDNSKNKSCCDVYGDCGIGNKKIQ